MKPEEPGTCASCDYWTPWTVAPRWGRCARWGDDVWESRVCGKYRIRAAVAAEREACAVVAETADTIRRMDRATGLYVAAAIRARGTQ